jgi:hypothetical protein
LEIKKRYGNRGGNQKSKVYRCTLLSKIVACALSMIHFYLPAAPPFLIKQNATKVACKIEKTYPKSFFHS